MHHPALTLRRVLPSTSPDTPLSSAAAARAVSLSLMFCYISLSILLPSESPPIRSTARYFAQHAVSILKTLRKTSNNKQGLEDAIAEVKKLTIQVSTLIPRSVRSHILRGPEGWASSPPDPPEVSFFAGRAPE